MTGLSMKARKLHDALLVAARTDQERLTLVYVYANRLGTPEKDVRAVKALLLADSAA